MSAVIPQYDLNKVSDPDQFRRYCAQIISAIQTALNGNLPIQSLSLQQVTVTFSANINTSVSHGLNKTGVNYIVISQSAAGSVYRGSGDTAAVVFLKASANMTATLLLI